MRVNCWPSSPGEPFRPERLPQARIRLLEAASAVPSSPVARAILPLATALLTVGPVRNFAKSRFARVKLKARERPRPYSWGHARVEWADGTIEGGWLRVGDAQVFTGAVPAEVARRLPRPAAWGVRLVAAGNRPRRGERPFRGRSGRLDCARRPRDQQPGPGAVAGPSSHAPHRRRTRGARR